MDQGCRALGTGTSESTCEMVIKMVLIKVKVRVGPSQGECHGRQDLYLEKATKQGNRVKLTRGNRPSCYRSSLMGQAH